MFPPRKTARTSPTTRSLNSTGRCRPGCGLPLPRGPGPCPRRWRTRRPRPARGAGDCRNPAAGQCRALHVGRCGGVRASGVGSRRLSQGVPTPSGGGRGVARKPRKRGEARESREGGGHLAAEIGIEGDGGKERGPIQSVRHGQSEDVRRMSYINLEFEWKWGGVVGRPLTGARGGQRADLIEDTHRAASARSERGGGGPGVDGACRHAAHEISGRFLGAPTHRRLGRRVPRETRGGSGTPLLVRSVDRPQDRY